MNRARERPPPRAPSATTRIRPRSEGSATAPIFPVWAECPTCQHDREGHRRQDPPPRQPWPIPTRPPADARERAATTDGSVPPTNLRSGPARRVSPPRQQGGSERRASRPSWRGSRPSGPVGEVRKISPRLPLPVLVGPVILHAPQPGAGEIGRSATVVSHALTMAGDDGWLEPNDDGGSGSISRDLGMLS